MNNEELLDMKFKLSNKVSYEINQNGIVTILEKQDHIIQKFFRKLKFKIPNYKKTTLDSYGSTVIIELLKGKNVREVGKELESKFGEEVNPLYERLLIFINHLYSSLNFIDKY